MQALKETKGNQGPKTPHRDQMERMMHPYVYPFAEKPEECNWQQSVWDRGTAPIKMSHGWDIWFNSLVSQCAHIRKNPARHACICYRNTSKGNYFALFVDRASSIEEFEEFDDPKTKSRHLGERKNSRSSFKFKESERKVRKDKGKKKIKPYKRKRTLWDDL